MPNITRPSKEIDHAQVRFSYRDQRSHEMRQVTLPAEEFIRRFPLLVLPKGCAKVRCYGIWSASCRRRLDQARAILNVALSSAVVDSLRETLVTEPPVERTARCPYYGIGQLIPAEVPYPQRRGPPCRRRLLVSMVLAFKRVRATGPAQVCAATRGRPRPQAGDRLPRQKTSAEIQLTPTEDPRKAGRNSKYAASDLVQPGFCRGERDKNP